MQQLLRDSGRLCLGFNLGMSASHRVPGGGAAGLPKCKIPFPLLIQSKLHSPAPPEPCTDESVNSLIVGVFGGFSFVISLPRPAVFLPWSPSLSQNAHSENTNPFPGRRRDVPTSWQALRLPGSGCDLSSLLPYEVLFMQCLEEPLLAL